MKNSEIATAFIYGEEAKNPNESFYTARINGVLIAFSYGEHFPICIKFVDGYLFNTDGYSNTTARHKNLIKNLIVDELSEADFMTTEKLKIVIGKIKYSDVKTKAEIVEAKI